jgi:hypothetical protein
MGAGGAFFRSKLRTKLTQSEAKQSKEKQSKAKKRKESDLKHVQHL